jgi:hypothetical protein
MCYDCRPVHFLVYRRVTLHLVVSRRVLEPQDLTTISRYDDRLRGLAVRVPSYRSGSPGSIAGATRFSEKQWVWNGVHSSS